MRENLRKLLLGTLLLAATCLAVAAEDRALFWRVAGEGATVYLMGSVHFADASFYPLRGEIEQAFSGADHLVVEVDTGNLTPQHVQAAMARGIYPPGETLRDHVSPETWAELEQLVAELGLPPAMVAQQRPGLLVMTLGVRLMARQGLNPALGIDNHFLQAARGTGKHILELESFDGQLEMLLNLEEGDLLLRQTGDGLRELQENLSTMVSLWKSGNDSDLHEMLIAEPLREHPDYLPVYKALFFDRNARMAEKIGFWLKAGGSYFVVVGAGHLVGDEGIVSLLEAAGYTVERI